MLVTALEHHSNFVPWQQLCQRQHAKLVVSPLLPSGGLDLAALRQRLSARTRIVACTHASNVTERWSMWRRSRRWPSKWER